MMMMELHFQEIVAQMGVSVDNGTVLDMDNLMWSFLYLMKELGM